MPLPESSFPDFSIQVTTTNLSAYPSTAATFQGMLTSLNGYSKALSLSCYAAGGRHAAAVRERQQFRADVWWNELSRYQPAITSVADFSFQIQAHDASGLIHAQASEFHVMDFSIAAPDPTSVTLSPGGNTTVNVLASSLGAFNERITITCPAAAAGISCAGSSSSLSPGSAQTIPVTIEISSAVGLGNYAITLVAVSADGLQHKTANLGLQVQSAAPDFSLQMASQSLTAVKPGQLAKTTLTVNSLNGFSGTVALSCTSPAPCVLTPATVSTFPAQATLQIDTTGASPANLNLSITGSVAGGNTHTASLTLPIVAFGLGTVTSPQAASAGGSANFSVQLVSENGYTGTVQTSCDATSLSQNQTCTLSSTSATLTSNGTTTIQGQITVPQGQAPGSYPIKFSAVDGSYPALSASQNFNLTVQGAPTFQIAVTPASTSLNAGQTTSNIGITITPQSGFTGSVNLSCASLPSLSTCTFTPATVNVNGASTQATMQISTTAVSSAEIHRGPRGLKYFALAVALLPVGLFQLALSTKCGKRRRRRMRSGIIGGLALLLMLTATLLACGGSGGTSSAPPVQPLPGTPSGTFTIVVSGTSNNIIQSTNFTLTVN